MSQLRVPWTAEGWGIFCYLPASFVTFSFAVFVVFVILLTVVSPRMAWSTQERVRLVELFLQTRSATRARRAFMREGNRRKGPTLTTIRRLVDRFRREGSVCGSVPRRTRSMGPRSAIALVRRAVTRTPTLSLRKLSRRTGVPRSTVQLILRKWLGLYPYKVQVVHKQKRGDKAKRMRLCSWLLPRLSGPRFPRFFFMSDEANFYLDGTVVKQNCRIWGTENPGYTVSHDPYAPHVTVWCAVSSGAVIGPFFFQEGGATVTVTAARYLAMLEEFFVPELVRRDIPLRKIWFQQDGATAHTTAAVLGYLQSIFGTRVVSKGATVAWPPRSPDLTSPDFFLWGYLKAAVYQKQPKSLGELKRRIRKAVVGIPADILSAVGNGLVARCRACLRQRGGHIEHVGT